ncbi:hypothetical protein NIES22_04860 [Calothrix brevissima NIES-22]|nr:hypothetical protein NIES22_04860 [Calothrix brevissima NIES-22]
MILLVLIWHPSFNKCVILAPALILIIKAADSGEKEEILAYKVDTVKAESAAIFKIKWIQAKINEKYQALLAKYKQLYELD